MPAGAEGAPGNEPCCDHDRSLSPANAGDGADSGDVTGCSGTHEPVKSGELREA